MRGDLPRGVVTFLFSDIEASTRLLREYGAAYADLLAHHRDALRSAFEAHSGVEIDSQGDAFLVAFERASDALAAAIEGQRALAGGPVRVRMGIHTGEPTIRDGAYVGLDVHRGARIAAAGHGGQVLLSATTRTLTELPAMDLGTHALKDLAAPERIYQLVIEGLPTDFPPLRVSGSSRHALPLPTTSFVGRQTELSRIHELLDQEACRLVTLVGPGGAGKSRLAIEAAAYRADRYAEGVTYVDLSHVQNEAALLPALAEGLGFSVDTAHSAGRTPEDQVVDFLEARECLLVMDDLAHLAQAAPLLERVLQGAAGVDLLATSRSRLQLAGEWVVEVGGLDDTLEQAPEAPEAPSSTDGRRASAAMQLFIERARQIAPRFRLDDAEWHAVAGLCRLVDGMPLGIELAAAWMHTLTPTELAEEVARNLDVLSSTSPHLPERHRSLRAVFDGSWRLLDEERQRTLARLAVFRGPLSREAAREVAGAHLPALAELVTRSLIAPTGDGRFAMHKLLRQFAAEALEGMGEHERTRGAHARYFTGLLLRATDGPGRPSLTWLRRQLRQDLADIQAAVEWAMVSWPGREVRPLLRALDVLYGMGGGPGSVEIFRDMVTLTERDRRPELDAEEEVPALVLARIRLALGLADLGMSAESEILARDCLSHLGAPDLSLERGLCLVALGVDAANLDRDQEARAVLGEAIALLRSEGADREVVGGLLWLGWAHLMLDEQSDARSAFEEAHAISARLDDPELLGYSLSKLGLLEDSQGRYAEALERHLEAHAGFESADNVAGVGYALSRASMSAYCLGRAADARHHAQAAFEAFTQVGHHWGITVALCRLSFALLATDEPGEARRHAHMALRRASATSRITALHALTALGSAEAALGAVSTGVHILRLVLAQLDLPAIYRVLAERQLASLGRVAGASDGSRSHGPGLPSSLEELVGALLADVPR